MKKISLMAIALLSMSAPAFADNVQAGVAELIQSNADNATGTAQSDSMSNISNAGLGTIGVNNSSGIINQNVNAGAVSNVGSVTNVSVNGGVSLRGGNADAGNPNSTGTQVSEAVLEQVNSYNAVGNATTGSCASANNNGISQISVTGSTGIISQQINAGVNANVGQVSNISIY